MFGITEAELAAESAKMAAELAAISAERAAVQEQIRQLQAALAARQMASVAPVTNVSTTVPTQVQQPGTVPGTQVVGASMYTFDSLKKEIEDFTGYPWYYTAGGAFALLFLLRR